MDVSKAVSQHSTEAGHGAGTELASRRRHADELHGPASRAIADVESGTQNGNHAVRPVWALAATRVSYQAKQKNRTEGARRN